MKFPSQGSFSNKENLCYFNIHYQKAINKSTNRDFVPHGYPQFASAFWYFYKAIAANNPHVGQNSSTKKGHALTSAHTRTRLNFSAHGTALAAMQVLPVPDATKPEKPCKGTKERVIESVSWPWNMLYVITAAKTITTNNCISFQKNKTKYFRLRLTDKVSSERPKRDLRET